MFKPKTMRVYARLLFAGRPRPLVLVIAALLLAGYCCQRTLLWLVPAAGQPPRGPSVSPTFAFDRLIVPRQEIVSGGVAKDGIPAITNPPTVAGSEAHFMQPSDRIAGVEIGRAARAYPLKVLTQHEIVNDTIGGVHVAVTYCPLCDSVAVFDRSTPEGVREFGVSGLLYNSNVLIYDRAGRPEGLWSQLMARGVSGPGADKPLAVLPVEATTWQDWLERHPDTTILHLTDEQRQQYQRDPYRKYHASRDLMFPAKPLSDRLPLKERVLGVWTDTAAKAYPLSALVRFTEPLQEVLDGKSYTLDYNAKAKSVRVSQADEGVRWMYAYWFAWHAFHPDADVFMPKRAARGVRARRTATERSASSGKRRSGDKSLSRRPAQEVHEDLRNEAAVDRFGNPLGEAVGLARDGQYLGHRLLAWSNEPNVLEHVFVRDNPLWAVLAKKGFDVRLERGEFRYDWLPGLGQLWIFSGRKSALNTKDYRAIAQFAGAGRGLYLLADNEPFVAEAHVLAEALFDSGVSGDYTGDSVIPLKQADLESGGATGGLSARGYAHPVLTGISFLYEGYTVSHLEPSAKLRPILLASDGQTLAAAADVPNQRVVIDCGWTRYYSEVAAERAGTLRYAENVAAFLAGQFEPPARR